MDIDEDYQVILTKDVSGDKTKEILLPDWIVSCLVKPADFVGTINGVANQKMPKYAELTQMFLQAMNYGYATNGYKLDVTSYIQDFPADAFTQEQIEKTYEAELATLQADTKAFVSTADEHCKFSAFYGQSKLEDFIQSNYAKPYTFMGDKNLLVTVNLKGADDVNFHYPVFKASTEKATIFRGRGKYTYYDAEAGGIKTIDPVYPTIVSGDEYYNVQQYLGDQKYYLPMGVTAGYLPAFGLKYYTNDIRGKVTDVRGNALPAAVTVTLKDVTTGETQTATVAADGSYEILNLNPADKYELTYTATGYNTVTVSDLYFSEDQDAEAAKQNDIEVNVGLVLPGELTAVYTDNGVKTGKTYIFAKDARGYANPEKPAADENDYMGENGFGKWYEYDQSNWVVIRSTNVETATQNCENANKWWLKNQEGYVLNPINLSQVKNKTLDVASAPGYAKDTNYLIGETTDDRNDSLNTYIPASFYGTQTLKNGKEFFMMPKDFEIADITWAVWNHDKGAFVTPDVALQGGYKGGFRVDFSLNQGDISSVAVLEQYIKDKNLEGGVFKFRALIAPASWNKDATTAAGAPKKAERTINDGDEAYGINSYYTVYPLNLFKDPNTVVTAVTDVTATKAVKSVRYYDLMGRQSLQPVSGINVKVTTFTDGTQQSTKVIK